MFLFAILFIEGENLFFSKAKEELSLKNVHFTLCDRKHYRIWTKELKIKENQLYAKFPVLKIGKIPVLFYPYWRQDIRDKRPKYLIFPYFIENKFTLRALYNYFYNPNRLGSLWVDMDKDQIGLGIGHKDKDFSFCFYQSGGDFSCESSFSRKGIFNYKGDIEFASSKDILYKKDFLGEPKPILNCLISAERSSELGFFSINLQQQYRVENQRFFKYKETLPYIYFWTRPKIVNNLFYTKANGGFKRTNGEKELSCGLSTSVFKDFYPFFLKKDIDFECDFENPIAINHKFLCNLSLGKDKSFLVSFETPYYRTYQLFLPFGFSEFKYKQDKLASCMINLSLDDLLTVGFLQIEEEKSTYLDLNFESVKISLAQDRFSAKAAFRDTNLYVFYNPVKKEITFLSFSKKLDLHCMEFSLYFYLEGDKRNYALRWNLKTEI